MSAGVGIVRQVASPRLHITLVAEDNPAVANMLRLFAWSLRQNAGAAADAPVTIVFNERADESLTRELDSRFGVRSIVRPRISTELRFTNKWNCLEADLGSAEWMLFVDWDIAICATLDPLLERLAAAPKSTGFFCAPEVLQQAWGMRHILKKHAGRTDAEIDALENPWYPSDRLPVFNTGVFAIRAERIPEFRQEIVPMCQRLHRSMRATTWNPLQWATVQWNRRHWKKPDASRRIIGSFFPRVHSGQIAVPTTLIKLGINFELLPHSYNWYYLSRRYGEDTGVRILHYMTSQFPGVDKEHLFEGGFFDRYRNSDNPGCRALANVVSDYNAANGTGPFTV